MFFASDNGAPAAPEVMAALAVANAGPAPAYGNDPWTARVERQIADIFEHEVAVFLVTTGTAANSLALSAMCPPFAAILAHAEAHAIVDEGGAPEFFTAGAKLIGLPGFDGKLEAAALKYTLENNGWRPPHSVMPAALTITQATELGTLYRPEEVAAIASVADDAGLSLHMDGARFANAIASLRCTPAELTWRAGVDALSFGFTKNGALAAEAVVFFDPKRAGEMVARRKRSGHLWSKGRYLAAQIEPLLTGGLWLKFAARANDAAARLSAGLQARGIRLAVPTEANEVFAILPAPVDAALREAGAVYHPWTTEALRPEAHPKPGEIVARFVCSHVSTNADVDALLAAVDKAPKKSAPVSRGA